MMMMIIIIIIITEWFTFSQMRPTAPVAAMTASLAMKRSRSPTLLRAATRSALLTKILNA